VLLSRSEGFLENGRKRGYRWTREKSNFAVRRSWMDLYVYRTNSICICKCLILFCQEILRLHAKHTSCQFTIRSFNENYTRLLLSIFATTPQTGQLSILHPQAIVQQAICLIGQHLRIRLRGQAAFNHQHHRIIVTGLKNVETALERAHVTNSQPGSRRHERMTAAVREAWVSLLF
jgi:hypothetical protein